MGAGVRKGSLQKSLTRLVLACVAFSTLPVAGLFIFSEAKRHAEGRWAVVKTAADVLASGATEAVEADDSLRAFTAIRAVSRTPGIIYARVEKVNGQMLADTGGGARLRNDVRLSAEQKDPGIGALVFTRTVEVSADIGPKQALIGRVIVVHKAEGLAADFYKSLAQIVVVAGLVLALALRAARRLQVAMTEPLIALTQSVTAISKDADFSQRVTTKTRDEVADLVAAFNTMLEAITVRDAKIDAQMRGLETEVANRTSDYLAARDEANAANAAKSDFLATMSHEIRTPMNGVMVMAELLAAETLPPKAQKHAQTIARSGRNLLAVINDILDFSKIEAGKLEVETQDVDICQLVDDAVALFAAKAREKGLELIASVHPDVPRFVPADPVRLGQVVANLISNGLKFTETGHVLVQVRPEPGSGFWRMVVSDTGIGIARDKLSGLFDAFTQADQSTTRRFGGTGLGLSISKRLVEAMHGDIAVTSVVGEGTRFHVRLPLEADGITAHDVSAPPSLDHLEPQARVDLRLGGAVEVSAISYRLEMAGAELASEGANLILADKAARDGLGGVEASRLVLVAAPDDAQAEEWVRKGRAALVIDHPIRHRDLDALIACLAEGKPFALPESRVVASGPTVSYPQARVLVVDDGEVNREVAREALARFGITADEAVDGEQALSLISQNSYDLVLMDGSMPVMDGYEASRRIRESEAAEGGHLPVVALTAHVVGHAAEAWREAGMDDVLHKPFSLAALGAVLERHLPPELAGEALAAPAENEPRRPTIAHMADDEAFDAEVIADLRDALANGREDFVTRVIGLYQRHAPQNIADMLRAYSEADYEALSRAAHALKSMSLNIGARAVAQAAGDIETISRNGARPVRGSEIMAIEPLMRDAVAFMNTLLPGAQTQEVADKRPRSEEELLLDELKADLERGAFAMVYQPIMDKTGDVIISAEALIRWQRGDRPAVGPDIFVPMAERSGLICQVGKLARELVMRDAVNWPTLPIAINVSPIELLQPGFVDGVRGLIDASGFDARRLVLEMTETAFLGEPDRTRRLFAEMRDMGIKLALDDFGVGYSSLTALHRFAFDKIKIDREFVAALDGEPKKALEALTIIQAVSSIGRAFGMQVVAEGIETDMQHKHLRAAGVHGLQGYLFAKPMPAADLTAWLEARRAAA